MYYNMEEISIMDDQDSLYLLLNGFMYPLSYQRTALYGGDACHPEKEMRIYFSDVGTYIYDSREGLYSTFISGRIKSRCGWYT